MPQRKRQKRFASPAVHQSYNPIALLLYVGIGFVLVCYCVYLSIEFILYEKTVGVLLFSNKESVSENVYMPSKNSGYYASREHYTLYHEYYSYDADGKTYRSSRYTRMIIYPEIPHAEQPVTVYYNSYAPQYSVLVPVTLRYWLINNALFIIYIMSSTGVLILRKCTGKRKNS